MIYVLAAIGVTSLIFLGMACVWWFIGWKIKHDKHHRYIEHLMEEDKSSYWKTF